MKRGVTTFVSLLATLVLLHVGLPHCTGDRPVAATAAAVAAHTPSQPQPAPSHVVHMVDAAQAGLPDRASPDSHDLAADPATIAAGDETLGVATNSSLHRNRAVALPLPDRTKLCVYRC